jgi:hypothetical protein
MSFHNPRFILAWAVVPEEFRQFSGFPAGFGFVYEEPIPVPLPTHAPFPTETRQAAGE